MDVKRYNLSNPDDCSMSESSTGRWVRYEDYKWMADYADKLVEHSNLPCLPKDLEVLREANSQLAQRVHELEQMLLKIP